MYVTGDTHGDLDCLIRRIKDLRDDIVLVTGDFGFVWNNSNKENRRLNILEQFLLERNLKVITCLGNHFCCSSDTEILTDSGFINIKDAYFDKDVVLANFDIDTREISYVKPLDRVSTYKEFAISIKGANTDQLVSLEHDVIVDNKKIKAMNLPSSIKEKRFILTGMENKDTVVEIEDDWIRLLTWVIMDGTMVDYSKYNPNSKKRRIQFKLSKERKIESLIELLEKMNIKYTFAEATMSPSNKLQPYYIRIYGDYARDIFSRLNNVKKIPKEWRNFTREQAEILIDTIAETDGSVSNNNIRWSSIEKDHMDIVQEICIRNNIYNYYNSKKWVSGFKSDKFLYEASIYYNKTPSGSAKVEKVKYDGEMYCFTMPKGTLITRRNGKVSFTGNNISPIRTFYEEVDYCGGKARFVRSNIIYLENGYVFNIDNKKIFVMGGAESIDKENRIEGVSWWREEVPSTLEFNRGLDSLDLVDWKVDYVLTHTCPLHIVEQMYKYHWTSNIVERYLEQIYQDLEFDKWFFGHHHTNEVYGKCICLYKEVMNTKR